MDNAAWCTGLDPKQKKDISSKLKKKKNKSKYFISVNILVLAL